MRTINTRDVVCAAPSAKIAAEHALRSVPSLRWLLLLAMFMGCAHTRPLAYDPTACYELKRDARKAGSYQVGAQAVAAGLAAGGAVVPLVGESKPAQVCLALGAVLFGALGLASGFAADDAQKDWADHCAIDPVVLKPSPALDSLH
jgi:hypothetical protein